jgi:6-phosphogluconolactonase
MRLTTCEDADAAAIATAEVVAEACRTAVDRRGHAVVALSGGETPWRMIGALRELDLPWERIHVAQVDERIAPRGDSRRNLTRLESLLVGEGPLPQSNLLAMPVEVDDLADALRSYQRTLEHHAGTPPTLDLVQLGLGADGHTASLIPGDPVLEVRDRDVAVTGPYQGVRRMTLTYPMLDRARTRLWLVTGSAKANRLGELLAGSGASAAPALRVRRDASLVVADQSALPPDSRS